MSILQLTNFVDEIFINLEDKIGIPEDQLKLVFCWIAAMPLGFINHSIRNPNLRHIYAIFWGVFLTYICVGNQLFINLASAIVVYILAVLSRKYCDWISFFFLFGLLLFQHTKRYINDFYCWKVDGSISLMMLLCKLTYFSFYYSDGRIKKIPSILEYMGFVFFYPTAIMGPVHDLEIYLDFINLRKQYSEKYSPYKSAFKQLFFGIVYIASMMYFEQFFHSKFFFQEEFLESGIINKLFYIHVTGIVIRLRYYGGWKFAQAGANASGISFRGFEQIDSNNNIVKKEPKFDALQTMKDAYEFEANIKLKTECWNTSVQNWLKNVFYTRFSLAYSPSTSLLLVFLVSAIWHGVHPVYYLGFAYWALLGHLTKLAYRKRAAFQFIPEFLRGPLVQVISNVGMLWVGIPINILNMYKVLELYQNLNYLPIYGPIVAFVFISLVKSPKNTKLTKQT